MRNASRTQEVGCGHTGTGRLESEARKALEDDAREIVPVADQVSEHTNEQRFLGEPRNDVLVSRPAPEYGCKGDIDGGERRRQERHFAAEQAKAGIDVPGKNLEEAVDDTSTTHQRALPWSTPYGGTRSWPFTDSAGALWAGAAGGGGDFVDRKKC